jgi:ribosomal protein S18 acetylase RimI-like enzyme
MADPHFYAIVPAGPDDAAALAQVHVTAWRETYTGILPTPYLDRLSIPLQARRWRRRLTDGGEVTLLAEGPQGAVGYCAATWSRHGGAEHEAEVNTLYLLREAQGTGLGRALLTASVRVMAARGATSLVIAVLRDNDRAHGFYERMGGQREDGGGDWVAGRTVATVDYRWTDLAPFGRR